MSIMLPILKQREFLSNDTFKYENTKIHFFAIIIYYNFMTFKWHTTIQNIIDPDSKKNYTKDHYYTKNRFPLTSLHYFLFILQVL